MEKPKKVRNNDAVVSEIMRWVATGGDESLSVEAQEVVRRLLSNNRDRLEIFRHVQAHRSVERMSKLNSLMDRIDRALFMPERIEAMSTKDLIAAKRLLLQQEQQDMELISDVACEGTPSIPDDATGIGDEEMTQISDIPPARRQVLANALDALLSTFGEKAKKRNKGSGKKRKG